MAWGNKLNYESVTKIISDPNSTLADLLRDQSLKAAIRKQIPQLIDFINQRSVELIDYALGIHQNGNSEINNAALQIITSQTFTFISKICNNPDCLHHLFEFIMNASNLTMSQASAFSRITLFLFTAKGPTGIPLCSFLDWPDGEKLMNVLFMHLDQMSINDLINYITLDSHKENLVYFKNIGLVNVIINNILNLTQTSYDEENLLSFLKYLSNIVSILDRSSDLLLPLNNLSLINIFFKIAFFASKSIISGQAFNLICLILERSPKSDDQLEDFVFSVQIYNFIMSKLPQIASFIMSEKPFFVNKFIAIDIFESLIAEQSEIPICALDLVLDLFNLFFVYPHHTLLHSHFLSLFNLVGNDEYFIEFEKRGNIRKTLIEKFNHREKIQASYWGHLLMIAEIIQKKEALLEKSLPNPELEKKWKDFINGPFDYERKIISSTYGGDQKEESESSDDFGFPLGDSELSQLD